MDIERVKTAKQGKASELQVAGELLRRGYDVFVPFVDTGVDLIASLDGRFILIQVKESKFYPEKRVFWQEIRKKAFDNTKGKDIFYIFTLKGTEMNYLIVPSLWIEEHADKFYFNMENQKWFFYFKLEDGKALEVRKSQLNFTQFLNNWEQLKG